MKRGAFLFAIAIALAITATPAAAAPPKRVVTLTPFGANTLALIGKRPAAVGQTVGDRLSPKLRGVPTLPLSHPNGPNMEQLAKLSPDLVLSSITWRKGEQVMDQLKIRSTEVEPYRLATLPGATAKIGKLTGRASQAKALAAKQRREIAATKRGVKRNPRVMAVLGVGRTPFAFLSNSWGGDLIRQAGGNLVTAGASTPSGFARISDEEVVARNPEIIIAVPHGNPGDIPKVTDYLKTNPAWKSTDAARDGHIYVTNDNKLLQAYPDAAKTIRRLQTGYLDNR